MSQVYNQAREIAQNESKRIEVENRERWLIDQNSIAYNERLQIALRLIKRGLSLKDISEDTGLSVEDLEREVRKLKNK